MYQQNMIFLLKLLDLLVHYIYITTIRPLVHPNIHLIFSWDSFIEYFFHAKIFVMNYLLFFTVILQFNYKTFLNLSQS